MSNNDKSKWKSFCRNIFSALDPSNNYHSDTDNAADIEDNDIPDWYDEIPDMAETPLQDAVYEATTDAPADFDPVEYLYSKNANSDIIGSLTVRHTIRTHYNDCVNDITEYTDYSVVRTERRQETVRIDGYRVNIAVEISSSDGISYHVNISFTLEK